MTNHIKASTSSDTLDSITTDDSSSSQKDSSTVESAIPPMPIRKMKDLTDVNDLGEQEPKFQKTNEEKEDSKSPELVGFKSTGEKTVSKGEPILTKEEIKNRELEKVKQEYAAKSQDADGKLSDDSAIGNSVFSESDTGSLSNSSSSGKGTSAPSSKLASLTADLQAVEEEVKDAQKEVTTNFYSLKLLLFPIKTTLTHFFSGPCQGVSQNENKPPKIFSTSLRTR